jgi:hypothetical protein
MSVPGEDFKDLKPKEIIGFDAAGRALVDMGNSKVHPFKLFVSAQGKLTAEKVEIDNSADQTGTPPPIPVSERWRGVDQAVNIT